MNKPYRQDFTDEDGGDFWKAVYAAGKTRGYELDRRLQFSAAAGLNEGVPSDGGFLVPQHQAERLIDKAFTTGQLLSRCTTLPTSSDTLKLPAVDEISRASGSRFGAMRMYWTNEGVSPSAARPKWSQLELSPKKLMGLVYASEELVMDSAFPVYMERIFGLEASAVIEDEIINGAGTHGPLGILKSNALLTVPDESGQAAGTITAINLLKMWSRLWSGSWPSAVWLCNNDAVTQVFQPTVGSGTALAEILTFTNGGPHLMGRPILANEGCAAIGTVGDLILMDPSEYLIADRRKEMVSSLHVRFLEGEQVFKFTWRIDGQPAWKSPIVPRNSSNTQSPFVAIATRS